MNLKHCFGLSVGLNVVLIAAFVGFSRNPRNQPSSPEAVSPASVHQTDFNRRHHDGIPSVHQSATPGNTAGTELRSWIDALRMAGVPEMTIAEVAVADFEGRWWKRLRELQRRFGSGEVEEDEFLLFLAQHGEDRENELRGILGEEGFRQWDQATVLREFDLTRLNLSASQTESLYQLRKGLDQQARQLEQARVKGEIDEADVERQTEAARIEYEKQLHALLGDDQYANLDSDPGAGLLWRNLRSLNATEAQLEAVSNAQRDWKEERARLERDLQDEKLSGQEYQRSLQAADAERDSKYQMALGADGFAEFQKLQDSRYKLMNRYASAWQLSSGDINRLYDTMKYYENSVRDYQQRAQAAANEGYEVDWPAVNEAIQEFSRQTEAALQEYLGKDRYEKLKRKNILAAGE